MEPGPRVLSIGTLYPPHALGGYEQVWRDTVERLRERGADVSVLASDWRERDNGQPEDPAIDRSLQLWVDELFDRKRVSWQTALDRERHNDALIRAALERQQPEIGLLGPMGGMPLGTAARLAGAGLRLVAFLGDSWPAYAPAADQWQRSLRRGRARLTGAAGRHGLPPAFELASVERWITTSEFTREEAIAAGIAADHVVAIPPGPDTRRLQPAPMPEWRGELLYVGRVDRDKGVEHAIRAIAELPGCRLRIAGAGDPRYEDKLHGIIEETGLGERVAMLGEQRESLPDLYADADVVLFPSVWQEPWGLVPLEAMAVGTPVVASSVGGASEYLDDGTNSLVVPPADPRAIAAAVDRLAGSAELRTSLISAGRATAEEHSHATAIERICDEVIGSAPGR